MIRLPHWTRYRSRIPGWFGHDYLACWPWVFVRGSAWGSYAIYWHEHTHLVQQLVVMAVGLFIAWGAAGFSWWLLVPLTHLPYLVLYLLASVAGYERNPFEVHARRVAEARRNVLPRSLVR